METKTRKISAKAANIFDTMLDDKRVRRNEIIQKLKPKQNERVK